METLFHKLEDEEFFCKVVREHYENVPAELADIFECKIVVDEEKVKYAHGEYTQALRKLSLYVHSNNPDHFKRAGALLHALRDGVIEELQYGTEWEEVESGGGSVGLHYADVASGLQFKQFFDLFHNEMLAFMFAFQCCDAYEERNHSYSFRYLENICAYLKRNPSSDGLETCFMIFVSLME